MHSRLPAIILCCVLEFCLNASRCIAADTKLAADAGRFTLIVQEAEIGSETFKISVNGDSECDISVKLGGNAIQMRNVLTAPDGRLTSIMTDAGKQGKIIATITAGTSKLTVNGMPMKDQKLPEYVYPVGNFSPHNFAYIIAAYNKAKSGAQQFDMIAVDGAGADGLTVVKATLSAMPGVVRTVADKKIAISRYSLVLPGPIGNTDTAIYTDAEGRILFWNVPGQKYSAIRDGYAELAKSDVPEDPLLSKPIYAVKIERKVMISMRDGVKLAADIYRPDADAKFPVILQRTPYGRRNAVEASTYAKRGYVFVAQDVRGRFDSEGDFHPFVLEAKDGYDSIEWCAAQPWSSGDVGMIGGSYLGFVQWAAAREGSKHLKCLIPIVSPPDPFFNVPYMFGELFLSPDLWWASVVRERNAISIESPAKAMSKMNAFMTLPLTEVDKAVLGTHQPIFQEWLKHSTNDLYYDQVNFGDRMSSIGPMPALHISGWFDGDGIGTKRNFAGMVASGHANQKLVYGPWSHAVNTTTKLAGMDFGPKSMRDLDTLYLRWFDRWLKGVRNGVESEPPVEAFIMGRNEWRSFATWPPREAQIQKWYFHSDGRANATKIGGSLSTTLPGKAETADRFTYDPHDPYIIGGVAAMEKAASAAPGEVSKPEMPDKRQDTLAYSTPTLSKELIVAGPISVHISAASSAKDTDWFGMLQDVFPDGHVETLVQGIMRARFRNSYTKPTLLKPGEIAGYTIDLWALGNAFKAGHKVRVVISSSCFPIYARNLNTGGDLATDTKIVVAKQTIYHSSAHPSYVLLPVLAK
jgi:putative CocE/NonD family hydrolase